MSLFPSPLPTPGPYIPTNTCSHFPSHLLIRSPPSRRSPLGLQEHLCTWGVLHAVQSEMESPKDIQTRLAMPAAAGRKRRAAPYATGRHHSPQQWPHTVQSIPLSAPVVASIELCRNKIRISSWSVTAAHTRDCGHAAQVLQLLSHPLCSPLSVLSTTTVVLCNSISFSCS